MFTFRLLLLVLLVLPLAAAPAAGLEPYLVRDIVPTHYNPYTYPRELVSLGNLVLLQSGPEWDESLWRSDGTVGGTYKLLENQGSLEILAVSRGRCFILSDSTQVWTTDGTLPGTVRLTESALTGADASGNTVWMPEQHSLYFSARPLGQDDMELWRTDGTPGGTYQVADIWPGDTGSWPGELTRFQGRVYFTARDPRHQGRILWRSDGTAQGTVPVRDVEPVPEAQYLHAVGLRLVFLGNDSQHGKELWSSDGTPEGTRLVRELVPGPGSPAFWSFAVQRKRLYFVASSDDSTQPLQLWVTDGAVQGTRMLTRFDTRNGLYFLDASPPDRFVFVVADASHGQELWSTDGTVQGTGLVRDICPGVCSGISMILMHPVVHKGKLFIPATKRVLGEELWVTDGTAKGTHLVRDICPGRCGSRPSNLIPVGSRLFFQANGQVWSTDGTASGTDVLGDFDLQLGFTGAAAGHMLIFVASDTQRKNALWCTDGTPGGTFLLNDQLEEDLGGSYPWGLMAAGNALFFFAHDGQGRDALWKSDGTEAGTLPVTDLDEVNTSTARSEMLSWTGTANRVFFFLLTITYPPGNLRFPPIWVTTFWTSDGTAAGTYQPLPSGVRGDAPYLANLPQSPLVFFAGGDAEHGSEPWITDGTAAGTRLLADLTPGEASSGLSPYVAFQGKIWFTASQGEADRLWQSDGTAAGTIPVGPELRQPRSLIVFKRQLWFLADDEAGRTELWSADGSTSGVWRRARLDCFPHRVASDLSHLYLSDGSGVWVSDGTELGTRKISEVPMTGPWVRSGFRLYYATRQELFVSDGTEAGTRPLHPAGTEGLGDVTDLEILGSVVLALTGRGELWETDGTDSGTRLVRALQASNAELVRAGSRVFFPSWDPATGFELWAVGDHDVGHR